MCVGQSGIYYWTNINSRLSNTELGFNGKCSRYLVRAVINLYGTHLHVVCKRGILLLYAHCFSFCLEDRLIACCKTFHDAVHSPLSGPHRGRSIIFCVQYLSCAANLRRLLHHAVGNVLNASHWSAGRECLVHRCSLTLNYFNYKFVFLPPRMEVFCFLSGQTI